MRTKAKAHPGAPDGMDSPGTARGLGGPVEFLRLVWAVDHSLQSASKRMTRALGVTGPQRLVIRIVGLRPGCSPGELAKVLHLHPSTLTGILKRLIARRAIAAQPDERDRRRTRLHLTHRGRELDRLRQGTVEAGVRRALAGLRGREVRTAARVLRRLAEELAEQARAWSP